jgi:hypothetical protein
MHIARTDFIRLSMPTNLKELLKYSIKYDHQVGEVVQITKDMFTSLEIATSILNDKVTSFTPSISLDKPASIHSSTQTSCGTSMEASTQISCGTSMEASTKSMPITVVPSAGQTKARNTNSGRRIHFKEMVQTIHEELLHGDVHKVHAEMKNKGLTKRRLLRSICSVIRSCSCDVSTQLQQQKIQSIHTSSKQPAKPNRRHAEKR